MNRSQNTLKNILLAVIMLWATGTPALQAARSYSPYSTPRSPYMSPSAGQQRLEYGLSSQETALIPPPAMGPMEPVPSTQVSEPASEMPEITGSTQALTVSPTQTTQKTPMTAMRPTLTSSLQGLEALNTNIKAMNELKDDPTMIMFALKTLAQFVALAAPGYGPSAMAVTQAAQTLYPLVLNMSQLLTKMGVLKGESVQVLKNALHELSANIDQNVYNPLAAQALMTIATDFIEVNAIKTWPQESASLKMAAQHMRELLSAMGMGPDKTKLTNEDAIRDAQQALIKDEITIKGIRYWAPSKKDGRDVFFILKPLIEKIIDKRLYSQQSTQATQDVTQGEILGDEVQALTE